MIDSNANDVIGLLEGIETGKLKVISYSSQWIMKGMKRLGDNKKRRLGIYFSIKKKI